MQTSSAPRPCPHHPIRSHRLQQPALCQLRNVKTAAGRRQTAWKTHDEQCRGRGQVCQAAATQDQKDAALNTAREEFSDPDKRSAAEEEYMTRMRQIRTKMLRDRQVLERLLDALRIDETPEEEEEDDEEDEETIAARASIDPKKGEWPSDAPDPQRVKEATEVLTAILMQQNDGLDRELRRRVADAGGLNVMLDLLATSVYPPDRESMIQYASYLQGLLVVALGNITQEDFNGLLVRRLVRLHAVPLFALVYQCKHAAQVTAHNIVSTLWRWSAVGYDVRQQVRENDMAAMVTDLLRPTSNPEIRADVAHQLAHYVPSPDQEEEFDAHKADVKLAEGLVQRGAPVQLIEMMGVQHPHQVRTAGAQALGVLATFCRAARPTMIDMAVEPVVAMLQPGGDSSLQEAACMLTAILGMPDPDAQGRVAVHEDALKFASAGALHALARLMEPDQPAMLQVLGVQAFGLLLGAVPDTRMQRTAMDSGALTSLVRILETFDTDIQPRPQSGLLELPEEQQEMLQFQAAQALGLSAISQPAVAERLRSIGARNQMARVGTDTTFNVEMREVIMSMLLALEDPKAYSRSMTDAHAEVDGGVEADAEIDDDVELDGDAESDAGIDHDVDINAVEV